MTSKLLSIIKPLLESEFNVAETMLVLKSNVGIFWSWGGCNFTNLWNKGLIFKVNGHHHKGYVVVSLGWNDTYTVHIVSTHGTILNEYKEVYFDMLVEIIDNRIEKIKDYQY